MNYEQYKPFWCLKLLIKTHTDTHIHNRMYVSSSKRRGYTPADTEKGEVVNIHGGAVSAPCLSAGSCHSIDLSYMTFTSNDCPASPQSCGKRCPFSHLLDVSSSRRLEHADQPLHAGLLYAHCYYVCSLEKQKQFVGTFIFLCILLTLSLSINIVFSALTLVSLCDCIWIFHRMHFNKARDELWTSLFKLYFLSMNKWAILLTAEMSESVL